MLRKINMFLIIGILMAVGAGYFSWYQFNFVSHSVRAQGTVMDMISSKGSKGGYTYHPVVDFKTPDGTLIKFTSGVGSNPPEFNKNDRVNVLYPPENPNSAQIDTPVDIWMGPVVLWILAIGFMIAGISIGMAAPISQKMKEELMRTGRKIDTAIVSHKIAYYLNRRPIWKITSTYTEGDKTWKFKSQGLTFDVSAIINSEGITTIPVWVDPTNMKKYYMAAMELKDLAANQTPGTPPAGATPTSSFGAAPTPPSTSQPPEGIHPV